MSFSSNVKQELCKIPITRKCCAAAECYGALLYCNTFTYDEIKIITESREFAKRLPLLLKKAFGLEFDNLPEEKPGKLTLSITEKEKITQIFSAFGYSWDYSVALHINLAGLEDECCRTAFIRGAFLAGGSVTDPVKRYHLELVTSHFHVDGEIYALLLDMDFAPKQTRRGGNYVTYFKNSELIEDFLTKIGAPVSAISIMEAKMEKELRNGVNRRVNCDTANLTKVVDAAQEQLAAIRKLEAEDKLQSLPDKLLLTAQMRRENPEATLSELADLMSVTKSCLNHRLRKLVLLSKADI